MDKKFLQNFIGSFSPAEKRYVSIMLGDNLEISLMYNRFQESDNLTQEELKTLCNFFIDTIGCYSSGKSVDIQAIDSLIEWQLIIEKGLYKRLEVLEKKVSKTATELLLQPNLFNVSYFKIFRLYSMEYSMTEIKSEISTLLNHMKEESEKFRN